MSLPAKKSLIFPCESIELAKWPATYVSAARTGADVAVVSPDPTSFDVLPREIGPVPVLMSSSGVGSESHADAPVNSQEAAPVSDGDGFRRDRVGADLQGAIRLHNEWTVVCERNRAAGHDESGRIIGVVANGKGGTGAANCEIVRPLVPSAVLEADRGGVGNVERECAAGIDVTNDRYADAGSDRPVAREVDDAREQHRVASDDVAGDRHGRG